MLLQYRYSMVPSVPCTMGYSSTGATGAGIAILTLLHFCNTALAWSRTRVPLARSSRRVVDCHAGPWSTSWSGGHCCDILCGIGIDIGTGIGIGIWCHSVNCNIIRGHATAIGVVQWWCSGVPIKHTISWFCCCFWVVEVTWRRGYRYQW